MATHFSVLAWRIPWTVQHGVTKSQTQLSDFQNQLPVGSSKDKGTARKKIILTITTIYVQHLKYIKHFENHISLNPHQTFCFLHHLDEDIEAQREHCSVHISIACTSILGLHNRLCSFFSVSHLWCQSLSHVQLFTTPWTIACQAPLSMEFSRQEYQSEQPFPSPGDLPNSGIKPVSPELQADSSPLSHQGSLQFLVYMIDHALPSLYYIASFIIGSLGEGSIFLHDICRQKAFHSFQQIVQNPQLSIQGLLQPFTYPLPHQLISTHCAPRHAFSAMHAEVSKCPPTLIKIGKSKFDVISCKEKVSY